MTKKNLIFDAFVAVKRGRSVFMGWPDMVLDDDTCADLNELLSLLNYLGRSESWIRARAETEAVQLEWNCEPVGSVDAGVAFERIRVAGIKPCDGKGWLRELAYGTRELIKQRRSDPPALRMFDYWRPRVLLTTPRRPSPARQSRSVHGVVYALDSKVLPHPLATVEVAERVRSKLMGLHKAIVDDPTKVSSKFSGKSPDGKQLTGHRHCYILPYDDNSDGRLDHLLVASREPFNEKEQLALDRLTSLWQPDGRPDVQLVRIRWAEWDDLVPENRQWHSVTPFVPTQHWRRGRGLFGEWLRQQLAQECRRHGLPQPTRVDPMPKTKVSGARSYRWLEFRRSRKQDTPQPGFGFVLEFPRVLGQPVALGYGCHFGLGQFRPT